MNPIHTFYAAVFRKDGNAEPLGGWYPEEALSREEALRGMTIWGAVGTFDEDRTGSLELGKEADFIILDRDIMTVSEKDILGTEVIATYVKGEKVY